MHCLSLIYFIKQPLHVSGIFTAHHQEVFTVYGQQLVSVSGIFPALHQKVFTVYGQQMVSVICLGDWQMAGSGWNYIPTWPAASQLKWLTHTNCCTYTVNTS
jgi:hypothetical protein